MDAPGSSAAVRPPDTHLVVRTPPERIARGASSIPRNTKRIGSLERLAHWIARAHDTGVLALKTETASLDPMQTTLCGIALAVAPNEAAYLPLGHRDASEGETSGLFAAKLCTGQIAERRRARSA